MGTYGAILHFVSIGVKEKIVATVDRSFIFIALAHLLRGLRLQDIVSRNSACRF